MATTHMHPREERTLVATGSFAATFAIARAITHAIKDGVGPFGNVQPGGKHIHHMTFGIIALIATGYMWLNEIGAGPRPDRRASLVTSGLFGAGAALTLDEFALWLNLEDDYWSKEGRASIDAIVLFGALLAGAGSAQALVRDALKKGAKRPTKRRIALARRAGLARLRGR